MRRKMHVAHIMHQAYSSHQASCIQLTSGIMHAPLTFSHLVNDLGHTNWLISGDMRDSTSYKLVDDCHEGPETLMERDSLVLGCLCDGLFDERLHLVAHLPWHTLAYASIRHQHTSADSVMASWMRASLLLHTGHAAFYQGSTKAFRLHQGSMKAALRLYEGCIKALAPPPCCTPGAPLSIKALVRLQGCIKAVYYGSI